MIPNCSDRFGIFRSLHSRRFLFPSCSDRTSIFRSFSSRCLLLPSSSDRTSVFRSFHSRCLLLPSSTNRICVLRNGYYWSRLIPFTCLDFFFHWTSFILRKYCYNRAADCFSLDGIGFYRIASFTICSFRNV